MGFFDFLRGVKRPDDGVSAVSRDELEQRLLAVNNEQVPFNVTRGDESDIQAEWKIVDAAWYEFFAKAGLQKSHRIYLGLNEDKHEVKALEEAWEVEWRAGVPSLRLSMEKQQGRTLFAKSAGTAYAFTGVNPLDFGQAYSYRFDVSEMKDPLVDIIISSGWTYAPVMTKRKLRK